MRPTLLLASLLMILPLPLDTPAAEPRRAMTVDDLLAVRSVSDPQVSPDGQHVVYVVSELDRASGKSNADLYLVPMAGGEPKRLTTAPGPDNHPRWSPDGKTIAFVSTRGGSGQVWLLPLDGGEARQLTRLAVGIDGPVWSPDGKTIAVTAKVDPGKSPEETAAADAKRAEEKSKVQVYDDLMVRHWDEWDDGKRSHVFAVDVATGQARDLTPTLKVNAPPAPFGGSSDYGFTADGKHVLFTAEPAKGMAWSTNADIWQVPVGGGEPTNLTAANPGADGQPSESPDGRFLAWLSQARAGFEADRWALKVVGRDGPAVDVTAALDRPVQSFAWAPARDGSADRDLVAVVDDGGSMAVYRLKVRAGEGGRPTVDAPVRVVAGGVNTAVGVGRGEAIAYVHGSSDRPNEIYRAGLDGSNPTSLTHHNDALVAGLDLPKAEGFTFAGADGDPVSGWLFKPPGFDPGKKYPVAFLIHGGPQGAWHDEWHNRWNYAMFAAPGYAVVAINPRGSTGYGQKFTDQISRDWTGRVYDDLMKGLDHALKSYPFLDGSKVAAAGGSYGGFMVNWIAGHSDRFKALISHAGVYDLTSMYGTTEELWFAEWEFGGPPWEGAKTYLTQTPSAFADRFRTPTLVLHGALDFRVPDGQGLGMFTALRRREVPARYVFFPDEGHWITKPANRVAWWREVHGWLAKYLQ